MLSYEMKFTYGLYLLICVTLWFRATQGDVFTSVPRMEELYHRESRLLESLQASIEYHQTKLDFLVQQQRKIEAQRAAKGSMGDYLSHPVNGFSLIKRFSRTWPFVVNIMADNYEMSPTLVEEVQSFTEDTQGAIRGLTRLQQVYDLDIDKLADGWVGDCRALSALTAADCGEVAQFLSQRHEFAQATHWLKAALRRVLDEADASMSWQDVASRLYIYSMLASLCEGDGLDPVLPHSLLSHAVSYTPDAATAKLFSLALDRNCTWYDPGLKLDEVDMNEHDHRNFNRMCRGEPKGPSGLKCRYVHYHRPELLFAPFKLEEVLISPPIVLVHQVISDAEIRELKEASLSKLSDCQTVHNQDESKVSTYRTCDKGWVEDRDTPAAARLTRRVGQLANLGMTFSEQHQVACYGLGGEYKLHRDALLNLELSETVPEGQRIATVMFYLNDVERGGYTVFPLLEVAVAPVKGSAVFWFNIHHDSSEDFRTLHGGCPVLLGTKWVLNKWIHEGGQKLQGDHCPSDEHFPKKYFYV